MENGKFRLCMVWLDLIAQCDCFFQIAFNFCQLIDKSDYNFAEVPSPMLVALLVHNCIGMDILLIYVAPSFARLRKNQHMYRISSCSHPACSCSRGAWPCQAWWTWGSGGPWSAGGTASSARAAGTAARRSASCGTARSCTCTPPC